MKKLRTLLTGLIGVLPILAHSQETRLGTPLETRLETRDWFPFVSRENFANPAPSVIDASAWLDAPAGKHGFVQMSKDRFVFEDGTPVKFWGVNIANDWPFAERVEAERWARYLAKYGVNGVRFHKFTRPGLKGNTSTGLDSALFDKLDYFGQQLRQRGIYYGWSHIYGHRPLPGDRERLLAYEEVVNAGGAHLKGSTIGLVNFAPDLQALSIELTVGMLNHRNPYTGLRYADDPALSFVELQNEDNIFFATTLDWVQACPTYKKLFCEQFSDWLKQKYGTPEKLVAAWGEKALNAFPKYQQGESLERRNILPMAHHGYLSQQTISDPALRQRLLDTALFLYQTQNAFYQKYVAAIRQTGYKGPIVGSCWQAGDDVAHYYNLHSDYLTGIIDRHNYFGGGAGGHQLTPGEVNNASMLSKAGSGLLGTGMQAVADRPFVLSEWISMAPNEWTAESAPLIAAYGLGLQGWDASYAYGSNEAHLVPTVQAPRHGVYNVDSPVQIGLYPVLARMIYRGDVQEGKMLALRKVHVPSLAEGKIGFRESVSQDQDTKEFEGEVPPAILAAHRTAIAFTDQFEPTPKVDAATYEKPGTQEILSGTGQLRWRQGRSGYFTINTPGTQGVVGFAGGSPLSLSELDLTFRTTDRDSTFGVVLVTSLEKEQSMATGKRWLVTALARVRNTGMRYSEDGTQLLDAGKAPLLMEPVEVTLTVRRKGLSKVYALDHDGRRSKPVSFEPGRPIRLDGKRYQTLYYELVYE